MIKTPPSNDKYREGWERVFGRVLHEFDDILIPPVDDLVLEDGKVTLLVKTLDGDVRI